METNLQTTDTAIALRSEITVKATELKQAAIDMQVVDQASNEQAGRFRNEIKPWYNKIDAVCKPAIEAAHAAHKKALAVKKELSELLDEVDKIIFEKSRKFLQMQHELERERIRKEREEAERKTREAQERALEKALKEDKIKKAETILNYTPPPPIIATQRVKYENSTTIDAWEVRILNSSDVPREWCCPDMARLKQWAKDNKGQNAPAGVEFVYTPVIKRK